MGEGLFNSKEAANRIVLRNFLHEGRNYFRFNGYMKETDMVNTDLVKF